MKSLLATILLVISPITFAEEAEIDLTQDAMYYCVDDVSVGIVGGESKNFKASKFTMKMKGGIFSFTNPRINLNLTSEKDHDFLAVDTSVWLTTDNGSLHVGIIKNAIVFSLSFSKYPEDGRVLLYASQGTCTKW